MRTCSLMKATRHDPLLEAPDDPEVAAPPAAGAPAMLLALDPATEDVFRLCGDALLPDTGVSFSESADMLAGSGLPFVALSAGDDLADENSDGASPAAGGPSKRSW